MPDFIQGDVARLSVKITDTQGVPVDPGSVSLKVRQPSGTIVTYAYPEQVTKIGTGSYQCDIVLDEKGVHKWRWEAAAPYLGAAQGTITVGASNLL